MKEITLVITAWNEEDTVAQTIKNLLEGTKKEIKDRLEIFIVSPDIETYEAAKSICGNYSFEAISHLKDELEGKPAALNLAFAHLKTKYWVFTDGDVIVHKFALNHLAVFMAQNDLGAVTGRPYSLDSRKSLFGYWGHLLSAAADMKRKEMFFNQKKPYFLSGYLYMMKSITDFKIPTEVLTDDAFITVEILKLKRKIYYSPEAKVGVYYPKNFKEWIRQKQRSIGGYAQIGDLPKELSESRSLKKELKYLLFPITFCRSPKEFIYSLFLYPARLYLWLRIYYRKLKGKDHNFKETWIRIESTKKA